MIASASSTRTCILTQEQDPGFTRESWPQWGPFLLHFPEAKAYLLISLLLFTRFISFEENAYLQANIGLRGVAAR